MPKGAPLPIFKALNERRGIRFQKFSPKYFVVRNADFLQNSCLPTHPPTTTNLMRPHLNILASFEFDLSLTNTQVKFDLSLT